MDLHRVPQYGIAPVVTVHACSPALQRMGAYVIGEDGVLARRGMSADEELRLQPVRS